MKKILILLFALFVFIGLSGCAELETLEWERLPKFILSGK